MKITIRAGILIVPLMVLVFAGFVPALSQREAPDLSDRKPYEKINEIRLLGSLTIEHYKLPNGLQVAIVRDTTTPIFTYQTWFKTGSADEAPGHQGLAHLFEHMMFRETTHHPMGEFDKFVNENGSSHRKGLALSHGSVPRMP